MYGKVNFEEKFGSPASWHLLRVERQHLRCLSLRAREAVYVDEDTGTYYVYKSRQHRKNRYLEAVPKDKEVQVVPPLPRIISLEFANISWHVAVWFTLGSIAWIVNGQYSMWPLEDSQLNEKIVGYWGLAGGLLFWVGAYLAVVEALNERSDIAFGSALRDVLREIDKESKDIRHYVHHTHRKRVVVHSPESVDGAALSGEVPVAGSSTARGWRWFGLELDSLGFLASGVQFIGATCFTIAVIAGTPGVISPEQWQSQQALIWSMQIFGSLCFFWSSLLLMLEEQPAWYIPGFDRIGWHSSFWNVVGSVGFLLCAVFGLLANWKGEGPVCCQFWGTSFNTYYGSWAFLIASVLLLIEVQNKVQASLWLHVERLGIWLLLIGGCASQVADNGTSARSARHEDSVEASPSKPAESACLAA